MPRSERATFEPTFPPPATIAYISSSSRTAAALRTAARERRDRGLGRADRAQPAGGVEVGAGGVEHADDDCRDGPALLDHLADDEVRVVPVRWRRRPRPHPGRRPCRGSRRPCRGRGRSRRPSARRAARAPPPSRPPRSRPSRPRPGRARPPSPPCRSRSPPASRPSAYVLEDTLGEGDDEHLAGCVPEHVVDGRREELATAAASAARSRARSGPRPAPPPARRSPCRSTAPARTSSRPARRSPPPAAPPRRAMPPPAPRGRAAARRARARAGRG